MISTWNLLWIIPLASTVSFFVFALLGMTGDEEIHLTEPHTPPQLDDDMNMYIVLSEDNK